MSSRLEVLKQSLRVERAGLVRDRDQKLKDAEELNRAIHAIDTVLGDVPLPAPAAAKTPQTRQLTLGESTNARMLRERTELKRVIPQVLKLAENAPGLSSERLAELVAPLVNFAESVSPLRISHMCRAMREAGEGIMGDSELWIYVPSEDEAPLSEPKPPDREDQDDEEQALEPAE